MPTLDALALMDSEGVAQVWLDTKNVSVDGEKFDQFYCTYNGKPNFSH